MGLALQKTDRTWAKDAARSSMRFGWDPRRPELPTTLQQSIMQRAEVYLPSTPITPEERDAWNQAREAYNKRSTTTTGVIFGLAFLSWIGVCALALSPGDDSLIIVVILAGIAIAFLANRLAKYLVPERTDQQTPTPHPDRDAYVRLLTAEVLRQALKKVD